METPEYPHNCVIYVHPRETFLGVDKLFLIQEEVALADNAIWHFIGTFSDNKRDQARLEREFKRRGRGMFIWKYYCAARCYIGGYKALSATLMLKRALK